MANYLGQDLTGQNFDGEDLRYSLFRGANLTDCSFIGSNLQGCNLVDAIVENCNFTDALMFSSNGKNQTGVADYTNAKVYGCPMITAEFPDYPDADKTSTPPIRPDDPLFEGVFEQTPGVEPENYAYFTDSDKVIINEWHIGDGDIGQLTGSYPITQRGRELYSILGYSDEADEEPMEVILNQAMSQNVSFKVSCGRFYKEGHKERQTLIDELVQQSTIPLFDYNQVDQDGMANFINTNTKYTLTGIYIDLPTGRNVYDCLGEAYNQDSGVMITKHIYGNTYFDETSQTFEVVP